MNHSDPVVSVSLGSTPNINYQLWALAVHTTARGICPQLYDQGLFSAGLVSTDTRWNALNPPIGGVPQPRPVLLDPGLIPAGATQIVQAQNRQLNENFASFRYGRQKLKDAVIASLGEDIASTLRDPVHGFANLSIPDIMQEMHNQFSVLNEADFREIEKTIATPFMSHQSFNTDSARLRQAFEQLTAVNQPMSEHAKITALIKNIEQLHGLASAALLYKTQNPDIATQRFDAIVIFIRAQAPNYATATVGTVNATIAASSNTTMDLTMMQDLIIASVNAAIAKLPTGANADKRKNKNSRQFVGGGAGGGGGRARTTPLPRPFYCFIHGNCAHPGSLCRQMDNNPAYSDAMRLARATCVINGVQGA